MGIPNDPVMLLSYLNTQLRDHFPSLQELCASMGLEQKAVEEKLAAIGYRYDPEGNRFA